MDPLFHTISLLSAHAVGFLFSAIWEGAVLAAFVALCLRLLPRLSAAARSVVWTNVFLLLVLLHVLPSMAGHWSGHRSGGLGLHSSPFRLDPHWAPVIAAVWAILSFWRGAQLISGALLSRRMTARAIPFHADGALHVLLQVGRGRKAELCTSSEMDRPSVFGFFHPRILLPFGLLEQISPGDLEQVVMHEMEHLRRADDWTNLLQKVGLVLFPLNPALLWVDRRLCAERELACDDHVLHSTGSCKAYAICLTNLAEYSMVRRNLSLALGAWERRSELVRRIHRILRRRDRAIDGMRSAVLICGLVITVLAGAVALSRSPQLLSFAPRVHLPMQARSVSAPGLEGTNPREFSGSPEPFKVVMPQKRSQAQLVLQHRRTTAAKRNVNPPTLLSSQTDWVVLTEWEHSGPPQRLVIAVSQDRRSSLAAVATLNGWLFIQI